LEEALAGIAATVSAEYITVSGQYR